MREFDLNIEKVLENWTVSTALREIIANALDEQILSNSNDIDVAFDNKGLLHIRDYGRGIQYSHLTQNENEEKISHPHLIGKFGVGLKDALATFDRNNIQVKIVSKHGIITMGKSHKHGFSDILTLHAYIEDSQDTSFVGTDFILTGCSKKDVSEAKNMFLKFSKSKVLDTTQFGDVLEKDKYIADIYINGVKVATEENFLFSYNITSLTAPIKKALNRERTNVGRSAYSDRVKSILLAVTNEVPISRLVMNMKSYSSGELFDELKWSDVSAYAVRKMSTREDVVFISPDELESATADRIDILKESGKEIIFIPSAIKERVSDTIDDEGNMITTFSTVIQERQDSYVYTFVPYAALTSAEKAVFDTTKKIVQLYGVEHLHGKICISESIRPSLIGDSSAGVWDPSLDKIIIRRTELRSISAFAGVLIHELIHAHTGHGDVDCEFEKELTRVIGLLAENLISSNKLTVPVKKKKFFGLFG